MQQKSKDFNAFWKTLFSFIITKLASLFAENDEEDEKVRKSLQASNSMAEMKTGFDGAKCIISHPSSHLKIILMWNFEIEFSDCDDLWLEDRLDHFIRTQNLIRTQSTTPKASIESTVQNLGYIINWQVIWFVSIMKIFSNFPTQRRKNLKNRISEHNYVELCFVVGVGCSRKCFLRKWKTSFLGSRRHFHVRKESYFIGQALQWIKII